jgi:uncharacterized protein (DUF3084 family)
LQGGIDQKKNEIEDLVNSNSKVIERKDKEIRKEKEIVKECKEEIARLSKIIE